MEELAVRAWADAGWSLADIPESNANMHVVSVVNVDVESVKM